MLAQRFSRFCRRVDRFQRLTAYPAMTARPGSGCGRALL